MKTLYQADVERVALDLLENQDYLTTLELKKELRKQGFWALQADVSTHMQDLVINGKLASEDDPEWFDYNDTPFQRYWVPKQPAFASGGYTAVVQGTPNVVSGQQDGTIDDVEEVDPSQNPGKMWMIFTYSAYSPTGKVLHVKRNVSRNVARAYYEKNEGVPYAFVGCSKVG